MDLTLKRTSSRATLWRPEKTLESHLMSPSPCWYLKQGYGSSSLSFGSVGFLDFSTCQRFNSYSKYLLLGYLAIIYFLTPKSFIYSMYFQHHYNPYKIACSELWIFESGVKRRAFYLCLCPLMS